MSTTPAKAPSGTEEAVERTSTKSPSEARVSSSSSDVEINDAPPRNKNFCASVPHEIMLVLTICFGQVLGLAPLGQVLGPLHIIGNSFNETNPVQLSWYLAAYSLTMGTFVLAMGRLGDMYGHRKLFAVGYAWLALWSLIAGLTIFAQSQIFFDVCRAMQGLGGAILIPNGLALLGVLYPPGARKAIAFCLFGAAAPTGAVLGALFSSIVAQLTWWPWAFFILAIISTFMVAAVFLFIPLPIAASEDTNKIDGKPSAGENQKFDWIGALTGVAGLVLFNVAWNQAPAVGWSSPYIIVLLILGVLCFTAFTVAERYAAQPLVPVGDLSSRVVAILSCIAFGWAGFGIWIFYWFQFIEVIDGNTPLETVAQLSASIPAAYLAAICTFILAMRINASWTIFIAAIAFFAGSIITTLTAPGTLYWKQIFWACIVMPFGMDMSFPAATLMLSNIVPPRHQGIGASLVATTVHYAVAFGLGVAGTVEVQFNEAGGNVLGGYRAAQWTGVGFTAASVVVALYLIVTEVFLHSTERTSDIDDKESNSST